MLVGRDIECAMVDGALEDARRGRSRVVVFNGEAGIGKTALLEYARARGADLRVLSVAGVDSESELPFAALHALLRPVLDLVPRIPEHQVTALEAVLALRPSEEPDRLAAYAGTLNLLAEAAVDEPLLVLVDDAHWLDRASAEAIAFAARRLAGEEIALLATVRLGEESAFDARGLPEHLVPPLHAEAAHALLRERYGDTLSPLAAQAIVAATEGNPLGLVELPGLLTPEQLDGREALEDPLPVAEGIRRAFAGRLEQLPDAARRSLLVAAAGVGEPVGAIREAAHVFGGGSLEPAEAAGLISLDAGLIAFRHPLLRATVYREATPADRRASHRALAEAHAAAGDPDQSAWHLAAAAEGPDEKIAAALEAAAERAVERGGHAARARALERAADLSPDPDDRASRLCAAARAAQWAGRGKHALALCERALPLVHDPLVRADLVFQTISTGAWHGRRWSSAEIEQEVTAVEQADPERAAKLLMPTFNTYWSRLDYAGVQAVAARMELLVDKLGPWWRPRTVGARAEAHLAFGQLDRAHALYDELNEDRIAAAAYVQSLIWAERFDDVRQALAESLALGHAEGNVLRLTWTQGCSALAALAFGELTRARALAGEALTLAEALDAEFLVALNEATLATTDAVIGDEVSCRARIADVFRAASNIGALDLALSARIVLGLLAVGAGRFEDAVAELEPVHAEVRSSGLAEPSVFPYQPDLVEALAKVGRRDAAIEVLDWFEAQATAAGRRWALAASMRCRGLLASPDELDDVFSLALALHDAAPSPIERARTELAYGERLRRANRRRDARPHLRAALETFGEAGAVPWRERAATELRATGTRVPPRAPAGRESLTPQELQIALLVAEGKTNREIGASIFLSPKTVEFHLTRVYRKLELHSRAELIRLLSHEETKLPAPV